MSLIEWQDSYSVGVAVLDDDHKRLIDLINRLSEPGKSRTTIPEALGELDDYVRFHFRREEEQLESVHYPELAEHKKDHARFEEWLRTVKKTYRVAPESRIHLAQDVNQYLRDWLINHILHTDMDYKDFLL